MVQRWMFLVVLAMPVGVLLLWLPVASAADAEPWLVHYCRLHPDKSCADAIHDFLLTAAPTGRVSAPDTVLPPPPKAP